VDPAARREEARRRVLGVDPRLDRVPERPQHGGPRFPLARGDPQLHLDEIGGVDLLGDRVLHLEAGVHLHEEELEISPTHPGVPADDELDRPGPGVPDRPRRLDGRGAHRRPLLGREQRRRRLLDDLLVAPLQGALALAEWIALPWCRP
jgi:hypothetical protein